MRSFLKKQIQPENLHHAYCLEGRSSLSTLISFLEKDLNIATRGNPDFWQGEFEVLGIDEGRRLKELQQRMSVVPSAKKIFVISANSVTHEAQNSLLKVFEEPSIDTHFFLLLPSVELLLPTLRSRLMVVRGGEGDGEVSDLNVITFLKIKPAERLIMLKPLIEEKDKSQALALADGLIKELAKDPKSVEINAKRLEDLLTSRQYLTDRASSVKMILEHIALTL